jgi:hypothetical protein
LCPAAASFKRCSTEPERLWGATGWTGTACGGAWAGTALTVSAFCDWLAKEESNIFLILDQLKTIRIPKIIPIMSLITLLPSFD